MNDARASGRWQDNDDLRPAPPTEYSESLELVDAVDDLLIGLDQWKDIKVSACEWTSADEALWRWLNAGPLREYCGS